MPSSHCFKYLKTVSFLHCMTPSADSDALIPYMKDLTRLAYIRPLPDLRSQVYYQDLPTDHIQYERHSSVRKIFLRSWLSLTFQGFTKTSFHLVSVHCTDWSMCSSVCRNLRLLVTVLRKVCKAKSCILLLVV